MLGGINHKTMKHYHRRNYNGRFISRDAIAKRELRKLLTLIVFPVAFAGAAHYANTAGIVDTGWTHIPQAEASWTETTDLCELRAVLCESERSLDTAISALQDALGYEVTDTTRELVKYLRDITDDTQVPFYDAVKTVYCESQWYNIQSGHVYKNGKRENSWGLAQISIDHHDVTREQALDQKFALQWMVEHWDTAVWYGYDRATGDCANNLHIEL